MQELRMTLILQILLLSSYPQLLGSIATNCLGSSARGDVPCGASQALRSVNPHIFESSPPKLLKYVAPEPSISSASEFISPTALSTLRLRGGEVEEEIVEVPEKWRGPAPVGSLGPGAQEPAVSDPGELLEKFMREVDRAGAEDISGEAALFKLETRPGVGSQRPKNLDYVYVHYRGFVVSDGREFEDSRRNEGLVGKPFGFTLGLGQVIKGWEQAVEHMTLGEVCTLWVRNDLTFAEDGKRLKGLLPYQAPNCPSLVGPQEHVRFEFELVEFGLGRALTPDKKVRFFEESAGVSSVWHRAPNSTACDEVDISLRGWYRGTNFYNFSGLMELGKGELPKGLETAINHMALNASARVRLWDEWATNSNWFNKLPDWFFSLVHSTDGSKDEGQEPLSFHQADDFVEFDVQLRDWNFWQTTGRHEQVVLPCSRVEEFGRPDAQYF